MKYIKVHITETGAPLFSRDYSTFNHETKHFPTLEAAQAWIKERYGKAKRGRVYRDTKDGQTIEVGWCYRFRNADWSHSPVEKWNQCDWVEITEVNENTIAA